MGGVEAIDEARWVEAVRREREIRPLSQRRGNRAEVVQAARRLNLSVAWVYRLLNRYSEDPRTVSLVPAKGGRPTGHRLLSDAVEVIIADQLERFYASRQKPVLSAVHREISRLCQAQGLKSPSLKAVRTRALRLNQVKLTRAREGYRAAQSKVGPSRGSLQATMPLSVVQIDHTLVDVQLVDDVRRKPIGRPWLTLVLDVATRMVLGFVVSLDPPSRLSVALAIAQAVGDKAEWLAARNLAHIWPCTGLFDTIKLDNAAEFRAVALKRGCEQYGMALDFRPPGAPWWGGHIERLMGTLMTECHLLPGTTFSNPVEKGGYDSEARAVMTRAELETWLAGRITGVYHNRVHTALGRTPLSAWRAAEATGWVPRTPKDSDRLLLDFLPFAYRTPRRDGLQLFNIAYWHPDMAVWAASKPGKLPVRYDPRDLSCVWLQTPEGRLERLTTKHADRPPITLWEHRAALAALREAGQGTANEAAVFDAIEAGRHLVAAAAGKSRAARRAEQRRTDAHEGLNAPETGAEAEVPDTDYVPKIYDSELW